MIASPVAEETPVAQPPTLTARKRPMPWADLSAVAVVLVFALLFCSPVLSGKVPIAADTLRLWPPWSQFGATRGLNLPLADSSLLYLSWESFSKSAISDAEWPMWDPYTFSGASFAANAQNQVYYPVTWLLWLLPLSGAIQALAIFNICLAGWGMYFLCRVLGVGRAGALLAGLAFCGSGILQTALEIQGVASVYGWLPWMILTSELALRERSLRWTAAAALCCGLQTVAGHLQWVIYSYFALACWLGVRSVQLALKDDSPTRRAMPRWRSLAGSLVRSAAIMILGLSLAAVHLAPFLELTTRSSRGTGRTPESSEPLLYMLRSALPNFFGTPLVVPNYPLMYNNLWYIGLAPVLLAVVGLLSRPRTAAIFWAAMALFAVLVTFGIGPFLYVRWLPGLQATIPNRIGYLFVFGLSVLAGIGLDGWLRLSTKRPRLGVLALIGISITSAITLWSALAGWLTGSRWVKQGFANEFWLKMSPVQAHDIARAALLGAASIVALGLVILALRRGGKLAAAASFTLVPILAIDLLSAVPNYNSYVEPKDLRPGTTGIRWLRQQPGQWRMLPIGHDAIPPSFVPNTHLIFNLPSVDGYDSLHDSRYDDFWGVVDPAIRPKPGSSPYDNVFIRPQAYTSTLASLLNVKYIVSSGRIKPPAGFEERFSSDLHIYENPNALPRAFLVDNADFLSPQAVLKRLGDPGFDPRREVLIEGQPFQGQAESPGFVTSPGSANITAYHRNSVEIETTSTADSYLVLADTNYPGWHVSVDGEERPLLSADYILRAVKLSPGKHSVRFWFLPSLFVPTLAISALSLALVLAAFLFGRVPRRRSQQRNRLSNSAGLVL